MLIRLVKKKQNNTNMVPRELEKFNTLKQLMYLSKKDVISNLTVSFLINFLQHRSLLPSCDDPIELQ